jgi:hypothetical protein
MTSPMPMPPGQPEPGDAQPPALDFEVTLSSVLHDAAADVVEAFQEMTESPLDIAMEHMNHVTELQMQSMDAVMHDDPDSAQMLLAQADQEMREAAEALHPTTDQTHSSD